MLVVLLIVLFAGFVSEEFEVADRVKFAGVGELVIFSLTTWNDPGDKTVVIDVKVIVK